MVMDMLEREFQKCDYAPPTLRAPWLQNRSWRRHFKSQRKIYSMIEWKAEERWRRFIWATDVRDTVARVERVESYCGIL